MAGRNLRGIDAPRAAKILEQIAQSHLLTNPNSVLETENSIQAFGSYTIKKNPASFTIYKNKVYATETFSSRSALAWCIADKYFIRNLKQNILMFDRQLNCKKTDMNLFKNLINKNLDSQQRWAVEDKLQDAVYKAKRIKNQLDKCINSAKYYQLKGFENEASRLGIKSPSRKFSKGI